MPCVVVKVVEAAKPEISVRDVRVEPASPTTEDTVTVYATLVNTGNADGNAVVEISLNGEVLQTANIPVPAGGSQSITYEIGKLPAGAHEICVDVVRVI